MEHSGFRPQEVSKVPLGLSFKLHHEVVIVPVSCWLCASVSLKQLMEHSGFRPQEVSKVPLGLSFKLHHEVVIVPVSCWLCASVSLKQLMEHSGFHPQEVSKVPLGLSFKLHHEVVIVPVSCWLCASVSLKQLEHSGFRPQEVSKVPLGLSFKLVQGCHSSCTWPSARLRDGPRTVSFSLLYSMQSIQGCNILLLLLRQSLLQSGQLHPSWWHSHDFHFSRSRLIFKV